MKTTERVWRIGNDFAGVLPRAHTALRHSDGWNPLSPRVARQLGEGVLDELALSGMTLTAPPPKLERSVESCVDPARVLVGFGIAGTHADLELLTVKAIRRRRGNQLTSLNMKYEPEPVLPRS